MKRLFLALMALGFFALGTTTYACTTESTPSVFINQTYSGYFRASIRELFHLDSSCAGRGIRSVTAYMKSFDGYSQAQLAVNGNYYGPTQQVVSTAIPLSYTFYTNKSADELDRDIYTLDLLFRGNIYIERMELLMDNTSTSPTPVPPPAPIEQVFLGKIDTLGKPDHQTNIIPIGIEKGRFTALNLKASKANFKIDTIEIIGANGEAFRGGAILVKNNGSFIVDLRSLGAPSFGVFLQEIRIRGGNASDSTNPQGSQLEIFGIH